MANCGARTLREIPAGAAIVLPSPNGSALCLESRAGATFTACLRNCAAVAEKVHHHGDRVAVIPAGERWSDGALRPCLEDLIGAGAVLAQLRGPRSPEAEMAVAVFERFRGNLASALSNCGSGKELVAAGFAADVGMAAEYSVSSAAPILRGDRFTPCAGSP